LDTADLFVNNGQFAWKECENSSQLALLGIFTIKRYMKVWDIDIFSLKLSRYERMHYLGSYSLKYLLIDVFFIWRKLVVHFLKSRYNIVRLWHFRLKICEELLYIRVFVSFMTQSYNHISLQYFLQQKFFLVSQLLL